MSVDVLGRHLSRISDAEIESGHIFLEMFGFYRERAGENRGASVEEWRDALIFTCGVPPCASSRASNKTRKRLLHYNLRYRKHRT